MKRVLVINAGSSSIKSALFGEEEEWHHEGKDFSILEHVPTAPDLVGHRVVHGGQKFRKTTFLSSAVETEIAELTVLAPLHNPACLRGIKEARYRFPDAHHFAVFDTAFHSTLPRVAYTYAGPYDWTDRGIRKYGFHGISYSFIASQIKEERCVVCHLGSGASLCALLNGKSIDTTMGFSPLDGLMMGSRCGSIDPSIPLYLALNENIFPSKIDEILNFESGLLGISGVSADMIKVEEAATSGDKRAEFALELFAYKFKQQFAQMVAALGGIDSLVFTAGIGEHSPEIRKLLCPDFLGIKLDLAKNQAQERVISTSDSSAIVYVIPTNEEWQIAEECRTAS